MRNNDATKKNNKFFIMHTTICSYMQAVHTDKDQPSMTNKRDAMQHGKGAINLQPS